MSKDNTPSGPDKYDKCICKNDLEYSNCDRNCGHGQEPTRSVEEMAKEMNKAIKCLALELPEAVWMDVNKRWVALEGKLYTAPQPKDTLGIQDGIEAIIAELIRLYNKHGEESTRLVLEAYKKAKEVSG